MSECEVKIAATVTELGEEVPVRERFVTGEDPTATVHQYRTLPAASTEMLQLGSIAVSVCDGIWIKAGDATIYVDTTVSIGGTAAADFNAELACPAGQSLWISPPLATTSIAVLGTAGQTYEYLAVGRTS